MVDLMAEKRNIVVDFLVEYGDHPKDTLFRATFQDAHSNHSYKLPISEKVIDQLIESLKDTTKGYILFVIDEGIIEGIKEVE